MPSKDFVEAFRIDPISKFPGSTNIGDFQKGVIVHMADDFLLLEFMVKKVISIYIKQTTILHIYPKRHKSTLRQNRADLSLYLPQSMVLG